MPKIDSIKHKEAKRAHIPSREEAGFEDASPKVKEKTVAEYPVNPVVHRGQDPELFWLNKYGNDDRENLLKLDIRSLYRHEHISPELLINRLYSMKEEKPAQASLFNINEVFGNALDKEELEKPATYYDHQDGWSNRLIQGDSLLVTTSLLEREGMAGKVQCIYFDPPYGIKYGSNWQMRLNDRNVKDGSDEHLTSEPEQIKAFRDTWELGIHSYLSYLRDRLLVAKELLTDSGSCFVQISDENVHLVRNIMDEVFGSENFISQITFQKTGGMETELLGTTVDYLLWYAKNKTGVRYRQLYEFRKPGEKSLDRYDLLLLSNNNTRRLTKEEMQTGEIAVDGKRYQLAPLYSDGASSEPQEFIFQGKKYLSRKDAHWKTTTKGLQRLSELGRIEVMGSTIRYRRFADDFPVVPLNDRWQSMQLGIERSYVVQTAISVIQRCILMTTDPGDIVLDPTCGSGTTAYVAERWGRRWISIDTSRIALNIAKGRLMTATFPYYKLHDEKGGDIRQGFVYKTVPHITLKSLANDEPAETETLFDQPNEDKKRLRVAGPFTVETLQNFEPVSPDMMEEEKSQGLELFEERIFAHLKSAGVKNGIKNEQAVFIRVERLNSAYLHAEGFYNSASGEKKAYLHIGPKFGTVSRQSVNEAVKECRNRGDADWLIILGFSFESNISNENVTTSMGSFEVTKVRMHDDLMQDGLLKKDKKAASFVTIGEPDVKTHPHPGPLPEGEGKKGTKAKYVQIEICGLDIYDPIKDMVKPRDIHDIAYWMVDDDYDGSNFVVKQVFFCGGDKDDFRDWQRGVSDMAKQSTKARAEKTLKVEIDEEAFDRLYGHLSHPIEVKKKGQKIAVRVISQFGEESTKVLEV
ncbi:MAG: site-specific DNA-methyltransferase [Deltaproteobacteria bacterium]|nr:site-specific DNA-methyltransferase [Deltaproteobacteria bacterium]